ncbi:MAG: outer membrane protein, partial [Mucilaginibacter sp.]|nr:outer membrane protein [Mucilaginibacter sp.]
MMLVTLANCTALKKVPNDELLYTGSKIKIVNSGAVKSKAKIKSDVTGVIRPKPNTTFLGSRPGLWLYYAMGEPKKPKGLRRLIKDKVAEPPVYFSSVDVPLTAKGIDAKLYNTGFLDSYCKYEIQKDKKGKTVSVLYTLYLGQPYTIQQITFPTDTSAISALIARSAKHTLIKQGDQYSLETLLNERLRIDDYLKRKGFYYFNPDYLLFAMDTGYGQHKVRLSLNLKKTMPDKSRLVYRIGEVNVFPDYKLGGDSLDADKLLIDSINYYKETKYIRPAPIISSIFLRPEHIYDKRMQQVTLSRLNGLGVFKFINVELGDKDTLSRGRLTVNVYLTPMPRKSLALEAQLATKSNNFIGPGVTISLRNRNVFKGAELIIYNVKGSFETQYSGDYKGQFTYELNPRIELSIPKLISPFRIKRNSPFVPHTKFDLEYSYLSRVGYFDMNSFKFDAGYKWKQKIEIDHTLTLLNVNYYNIYHTSSVFNDLINSNALIKRRFEEQFLLGIAYSFFYNQQLNPVPKRNKIYFNGNIELAGNALSLISRLVNKRPVSSSNPSQILGVNFAQFARFDIDVRDYVRIPGNTILVGRFIAGWGIPYGNASALPYSKQFFAGGAYSLRGFQANSVGPGVYS